MIQIGVIGSSSANELEERIAYEVGREIARRGCVLVCGGLGGVMEAACKGAKDEGGITVGIIPSLNKEDANPYVDVIIPTGYGLARNHLVVRASDVLIAVGGYIGTLSEISFALNENKTVIGINSWELDERRITKGKYLKAENAHEAVDMAIREVQ